ncbi:MAG: formate dehydrogenase accessory protein FdhE [Desulfobacterium sp.]|nr:formate dehydrogenase accessory protein FdhE [Desulfobacterium sp.]
MNKIERDKDLISTTLKILKEKEHLPKDLMDLLGETATLQLNSARDISINLPDLTLSDSGSIKGRNTPILTPATLPLDRNHIAAFFSSLIQKIISQNTTIQENTDQATTDWESRFPAPLVEAAKLIDTAFKKDQLDLDRAVDECLQGPRPILAKWAATTPKAPAALNFLVRAAIAPSLTAGVAALAEWINKQEQPSEQKIRQTGTCPICGSLPHMLELREKEGFRFAFCSLCQHDYRIRRLACPVCDTTDMGKLKFFTVPEEPGFRVETCEACKTYIKTIDFRGFDRRSFPPLNDLESFALDFIAQDQGYTRATLSIWGM